MFNQTSIERMQPRSEVDYHLVRLAASLGLLTFSKLGIAHPGRIQGIDRAYIQAAPHRSLWDIPALGVAAWRADKQKLHFMAKEELKNSLEHTPLSRIGQKMGKTFEGAGAFYVARKEPMGPATIEYLSRIKEEKGALAIFPGATRSRGREIGDDELKAMFIALPAFEHGLDVMAVGIAGTEKGYRGLPQVCYGDLIPVDKVDFEADPAWSATRRAAELTKAIGKTTIRDFMAELLESMRDAQAEAHLIRDQRKSQAAWLHY